MTWEDAEEKMEEQFTENVYETLVHLLDLCYLIISLSCL